MDKKLLKTLQEDSANSAEESKKKAATTAVVEEKKVEPIVPEVKAEETKTEEVKPIEATHESDKVAELLKELKLSSLDELKARINPPPAKTEDEDQADLIAFVTQSKLGTPNDFFELNKVKTTKDFDLTKDEFFADAKKKDPKATDEKIQAKFDRKFGEKVTDDITGEEKVVYDDEDVKDYADKIRNTKASKIESFKTSYNKYQDDNKFVQTVQKEAEQIKKSIPKSIELSVGNEKFPYIIDDSLRPQIEEALQKTYVATKLFQKQNNLKLDENFNISEAIEDVVWRMNKQNIMQVYASNVAEAKVKEALKPFSNAHTETLETKEVSDAKVIPSIDEQMKNIARQVPNFGRRS